MRPVKQTRTGRDGNCTAACLATIFELPIEAVPDPAPLWAEGKVEQGHALVNDWLADRGLYLQQLALDEGAFIPCGYWIATMRTPGGQLHATVWKGSEFLWDPSPAPFEDLAVMGELLAVNAFVVIDPVMAWDARRAVAA